MSERQVESVKQESGSVQRVFKLNESDANNNGIEEQRQVNEAGEKLDKCQAARIESRKITEFKYGCESTSLAIGSEDWQLIDMDEYSTSIGVCHNNNNQCENEKLVNESRKKNLRKYVDIDSLGPRHQYSPTLTHLYTAIYSLLPIVSCLALLTLSVLIFTRFYFISLIYFSYIIYDRNTCNRGE